MEEEVAVQDVFKTAYSAQKSLIWKYYLISTMKNTATHCHCAKCHYCNIVMDWKVPCMQKHMLNCERVGHEDKANLNHHLRSLPALPQDNKEEVDDGNSLAMSSSQSSSVVKSFSSTTTLNNICIPKVVHIQTDLIFKLKNEPLFSYIESNSSFY
jgi:hypothetical protein